ncbi:MAG: GntR family transcriptional regulator [Rhodobacterales bacterium]|nr:GntR family transcriptional regulator [Rhodobacterales bacterium]
MTLTLFQSTYQRLRADIIFGRRPPGQRLRLEELREGYGASVPTLREVLNRLASEGFVATEDQRGFAVAPVSAENLRELAQLRKLIEGDAMAQSVFDKYLRYQMVYLTFRGEIAAAEHRALLQAALARDVAAARQVLERHIDGGVDHALAAHAAARG